MNTIDEVYAAALDNYKKASALHTLAQEAADAAFKQELVACRQYIDACNARDEAKEVVE